MDTVTQALLGGAVAYIAVGRRHSARKAIAWGATIAVLPDLDILIPYENDLAATTHHRGWTHSWFIHTLLAPFISTAIHRFDQSYTKLGWFLLVWLALITHSALDALTVYGTQLFWPLATPPISGGSIFIIDPLYSVSLLFGLLALLIKPKLISSHKIMRFSFMFSCLYLTWGLTMQALVFHQSKASLVQQGIKTDTILVSATPLNTLLWRIVAIDSNHYYQGFRSVFDQTNAIVFDKYNRNLGLLAQSDNVSALSRLHWFTSGFYALDKHDTFIVANDLRMGIEPNYFFKYKIATTIDGQIETVTPNLIQQPRQVKQSVAWTWQRIWSQKIKPYNPKILSTETKS